MNILEEILVFLDANMNEPSMYGWFHIMFLIFLISSIFIVKLKFSHLDNKKIKRVLLVSSTICLLLEFYKQLNFSFNSTTHLWDYQWYAFPFQFCSMPMYIGLIAGLTKKEKLEKACYTFLASYGLLGGILVMLYPSTVFIDTIGINIQTMVHHGLMVFMGCLLFINNKVTYDFNSLLLGIKVFVTCVLIALIIDISTYYIGINNGLEMFFISPFHTSSLPVFNIIYEKVNYFIFLFIYIGIFSLGSLGILKLVKKTKKS